MSLSPEDSGTRQNALHLLLVLSRDPNNFEAWVIDMRAHLRSRKLWKYTQEECKGQDEEKWEAAADAMTPFIKADIKKELKEEEFNNGYKMMTRLRELLRRSGETEFMRLCKEYYSLSYKNAGDTNINDFLTRAKLLEDRIDATKIELTGDRRTLLCLSMAFADNSEYHSLLQVWSVTPDMTADRARAMLQEEDKRISQSKTDGIALATRLSSSPQPRQPHRSLGLHCQWCSRDSHDMSNCWELHPHLKPEKRQKKNGQSTPGKYQKKNGQSKPEKYQGQSKPEWAKETKEGLRKQQDENRPMSLSGISKARGNLSVSSDSGESSGGLALGNFPGTFSRPRKAVKSSNFARGW